MNYHNAPEGASFGLLMIMVSAILWGTVGIFVQTIYTLSEGNSFSIGFLRLAISLPVLFFACARTLVGWQMLQIAKRDLALMLLTGAMTAFYQVCYFTSISYIGVATATLITLCTAPVWVALLASLILHERFTLGILLAGLCAVGGTALLVNVQPGQITVRSQILGVCLALSSALAYASVTLCSRLLSRRYHPLQSLTVSFFAGAVFLLPIALITGLVLQYPFVGWIALLYLGIVTTAFAYVLYFSGIRHTPATVASIATLLEPLTSTILAWWLLGENLGTSGIIGGVLLLIAIGTLYWDLRWNQRHSRRN